MGQEDEEKKQEFQPEASPYSPAEAAGSRVSLNVGARKIEGPNYRRKVKGREEADGDRESFRRMIPQGSIIWGKGKNKEDHRV